MGTGSSWKLLALRRETGRSSSLVAGNMERVECRAPRDGIFGGSGSKKLKLKVDDLSRGGSEATAAILLTMEAASGSTAATEPKGVGTTRAFFPISSGN